MFQSPPQEQHFNGGQEEATRTVGTLRQVAAVAEIQTPEPAHGNGKRAPIDVASRQQQVAIEFSGTPAGPQELTTPPRRGPF